MVKISHDADGYGINRNIVECKDLRETESRGRIQVLIET